MVVFDVDKNVLENIDNSNASSSKEFNYSFSSGESTRYIRLSCVTAEKNKAYVTVDVSIIDVLADVAYAVRGVGNRNTIDDLNLADPNKVYTFTKSVANEPTTGGTMLTLNNNEGGGGQIQVFLGWTTMYIRGSHGGIQLHIARGKKFMTNRTFRFRYRDMVQELTQMDYLILLIMQKSIRYTALLEITA